MIKILKFIGVRDDFARLFFVNEYKTLTGEKNVVIIKLIVILLLTLFALGFAVGSIDNLNKKMTNPFTNWVDLAVTPDVSLHVGSIMNDFENDELRARFNLSDIRGSKRFPWQIYRADNATIKGVDTLFSNFWGLTIDSDDKLLNVILEDDNRIWKIEGLGTEDKSSLANCEIIATPKLLKKLGYDPSNIEIGNVLFQNEVFPLPIKIVGVVEELPRFCDFVCSPMLSMILNNTKEDAYFCDELLVMNEDGMNNYTFITDSDNSSEISDIVKSYYELDYSPKVYLGEDIVSGKNTYKKCRISFNISNVPELNSLSDLLIDLRLKNINIAELTTIECSGEKCRYMSSKDYYFVAFNFNRLDKIREFKGYMLDTYSVEIDMSQVESKENFSVVTNLTSLIAIILLAFGILSIILFVNSLLQAHLYKVRSNLGTFKAFGISDSFLNKTYLKIIFSFLTLSILIALGVMIVYDRIEQYFLLEESKFNIFSMKVLFSMILLVIISLIISSRTIKRILGDTPGNLIYER